MESQTATLSTLRSLGALAPDEECADDFGIVADVCKYCQILLKKATFGPFGSAEDRTLRSLHWAEKRGCIVCRFVLDRPFIEPGIDGRESKDLKMDEKIFCYVYDNHDIEMEVRSFRESLYIESVMLATPELDGSLARKCSMNKRPLSTHTTPEICNSFLQQQIVQCGKSHRACPSVMPVKMPKRVIDTSPCGLTSSTDLVCPRLVTTNVQHDPWVTLSYCWGSDGANVTATKASVSSLMEGIDVSKLPKTIQDALTVMRSIGFRYLWIDALCIIQDDPADLAEELAEMCNIYKNSALTLAIDGASSVSQGFLGPRIPVEHITVPYCDVKHGFEMTCQIRQRSLVRTAHDCLGLRGWALQETILSPRTLHIGKQQLFWRCQSIACSERGLAPDKYGDGLLKRFFLKPVSDDTDATEHHLRADSLVSSWYQIVNDYVTRSLSVATDKLPAIAGLAEEIHNQTGFTYRAGLWEQDVHRGLLWCVERGTRAKSYQAPSWSWASLHLQESSNTNIYLLQVRETDTKYGLRSDLESVSFHMKGIRRPFIDTPGEDSYLLIRASWISASPEIWINRKPPVCSQNGPIDYELCMFAGEHTFCYFDYEIEALPEERLSSISYLLVAHNSTDFPGADSVDCILWCLMLVPTGNGDDEFKRVGLAHIPRQEHLPEPEWTTRTIKIF